MVSKCNAGKGGRLSYIDDGSGRGTSPQSPYSHLPIASESAAVDHPRFVHFFPEYFFKSNRSFLRVAGRIAFGWVMMAVARA